MGVEGGGGPTFGAFGRNFPGSQYEIFMPVFQTVINLTNKVLQLWFLHCHANTREKAASSTPWFPHDTPINNVPSLISVYRRLADNILGASLIESSTLAPQ